MSSDALLKSPGYPESGTPRGSSRQSPGCEVSGEHRVSHRRDPWWVRRRYREILGLQLSTGEDGAGWLGFFRDPLARGLSGVGLVTSDVYAGLVEAVGVTLPGASWQRCRTHSAENLMTKTPKSA